MFHFNVDSQTRRESKVNPLSPTEFPPRECPIENIRPREFSSLFPFPSLGLDKTLTSKRCLSRVLTRRESSLVTGTTTSRRGAHRTLILSFLNPYLVRFYEER